MKTTHTAWRICQYSIVILYFFIGTGNKQQVKKSAHTLWVNVQTVKRSLIMFTSLTPQHHLVDETWSYSCTTWQHSFSGWTQLDHHSLLRPPRWHKHSENWRWGVQEPDHWCLFVIVLVLRFQPLTLQRPHQHKHTNNIGKTQNRIFLNDLCQSESKRSRSWNLTARWYHEKDNESELWRLRLCSVSCCACI